MKMKRYPEEDNVHPLALTGTNLDKKLVCHSGEPLVLILCKFLSSCYNFRNKRMFCKSPYAC